MPIAFIHPASFIIAGPSKSGKTVFVRRLLTEHMLYPEPTRIVFIYSEWQPEYEKILQIFPNTEFVRGPMQNELYESFNVNERNLLILDDQMTQEKSAKSDQLEKYFVQGSHHKNLSIIFIVQNLYEKGKAMRTSSLNANYLILYKNPRDKGQASILARQMYPNQWRSFVSAFQNATELPFSYMVIDLCQDTPEPFRLRGRVFEEEDPGTDVYIMEDELKRP